MALEDEVGAFLKDFKQKMGIWDVYFLDDRGKNAQTLADLELRPIDREKILHELDTKDYCQGPLPETLYGGSDMWVFGKQIRKKEVYIKITLGAMSRSVLCISFHIAEHKMNYPLK